jgi:hypothetical protein
MTVEEIKELGWGEVPDRGLKENSGHLFYGFGDWVLRYWTIAPRFELSYKNSIAYDSAIADYENFGPGKEISISKLKEVMGRYAILS